jgi:divalent metal cation (Fe/Co/Zn/Cd) transporter
VTLEVPPRGGGVGVRSIERRALLLAYATITYNMFEALVAAVAGASAGSPALLSFGGDSVIESVSALVIVWQFRGDSVARERRAQQLVGVAFVVLAAGVAVGSIAALIARAEPEASPVGIALTAVSLAVMPSLAIAKRRTGRALTSKAVQADSLQTWLCAGLSGVLLLGLGANAAWGWWWADPVAALVIASVAAREGVELLRGRADPCC